MRTPPYPNTSDVVSRFFGYIIFFIVLSPLWFRRIPRCGVRLKLHFAHCFVQFKCACESVGRQFNCDLSPGRVEFHDLPDFYAKWLTFSDRHKSSFRVMTCAISHAASLRAWVAAMGSRSFPVCFGSESRYASRSSISATRTPPTRRYGIVPSRHNCSIRPAVPQMYAAAVGGRSPRGRSESIMFGTFEADAHFRLAIYTFLFSAPITPGAASLNCHLRHCALEKMTTSHFERFVLLMARPYFSGC